MTVTGKITKVQPAQLEALLRCVASGDRVVIATSLGPLHGTVTEVREERVTIVPVAEARGVRPGDTIAKAQQMHTRLGVTLLGRAINALGHSLDGRAVCETHVPIPPLRAPSPVERREISEPFWSGIRAIDALLTIGRGARIGVFAGPGLGKSTLLEMLVAHSTADAVVVGLAGERGREAEQWFSRVTPRTTIVCATSDRSAYERIHAAQFAMAQACGLREAGLHVLLVLDSLARYAAALREAAVGAGEPVGRGGYPARVFHELAGFVECAGATKNGSVTMIATVLSDGDERDPVSDAARSLLDGHIQLSPALAKAARFPAIDVPASVSRTMSHVITEAHRGDAERVRAALATLESCADVRDAGIMPVDPVALRAIAAEPDLDTFLRQGSERVTPGEALGELAALADTLEEAPWTSLPTSLP
ncbi:MAG: hypothetical protein JO165_10730 [Candidatus Eremiobacteraeota bacterium]|nr:hypothetical protein [Candidatus Eremiobacteraeota bacterium]